MGCASPWLKPKPATLSVRGSAQPSNQNQASTKGLIFKLEEIMSEELKVEKSSMGFNGTVFECRQINEVEEELQAFLSAVCAQGISYAGEVPARPNFVDPEFKPIMETQP
ncbi:MAG TPA: hypothetical protein VLF79_00760 [Candidatus Saccharimonadales bacterium]|nr:hypothetical protein [Candidatus Saccharimonadales bacterium]